MTKKKLKRWGWFFILILPLTLLVWIIVSAIFWIIGGVAVWATAWVEYGTSIIEVIRTFINWLLWIFALIGIFTMPVGIVFLVKAKKKWKIKEGENKREDNVYIAKSI